MKLLKFRAECAECGAWSPRPTSMFTVEKWMRSHTTSHLAPTCEHDWRPLGLYGSLRCKTCGLTQIAAQDALQGDDE